MPKESDFFLLLHIAKAAGFSGKLETSTSEISKELGISQQSVSRKLRALEDGNLIERNVSPRGIAVSVTTHGRKAVESHFSGLKQLFSGKKQSRKLTARVSSGLGEGAYYISQKQYLVQIVEKLGFKPFIGTLNLIADENELRQFLSSAKPIEISGFKTRERTFGSLECFKVKVNGRVNGAIVVPERTAHEKNLIEVIAPLNLRRKFSLKDGSRVELEALQ